MPNLPQISKEDTDHSLRLSKFRLAITRTILDARKKKTTHQEILEGLAMELEERVRYIPTWKREDPYA